MTEEEKKAIEIVKGISTDDLLNYWEGPEEPYNAIQVALNLIQKQDTEINKLKNVIDRMAGAIDRAYFDREGMKDWFENEILPKDEFGLVDYKEKYIRQPIIKEYFMKEDK